MVRDIIINADSKQQSKKGSNIHKNQIVEKLDQCPTDRAPKGGEHEQSCADMKLHQHITVAS